MICPTLNKVRKQVVDFDPQNLDHLKAFQMLSLGNKDERGNIHVKQHPTLRFHLESPFVSVPDMMNNIIGHEYLKLKLAA
jgi:hypothetical protein